MRNLPPAPGRPLARRTGRQLVGDQNSSLARSIDERDASLAGRRLALPGVETCHPRSQLSRRILECRRPSLQQPFGCALDIANRSANAAAFPDVDGLEVVKHAPPYSAPASDDKVEQHVS